MGEEDTQFKPGVAAIIIIAIGILVMLLLALATLFTFFLFCFGFQIFALLFIFTKRQIMRFAQKFPSDGPHATIGMDAPKKLVEEIERRLNLVKEIRYEPILMYGDNEYSCDGELIASSGTYD